jgi:hypothetical protein
MIVKEMGLATSSEKELKKINKIRQIKLDTGQKIRAFLTT